MLQNGPFYIFQISDVLEKKVYRKREGRKWTHSWEVNSVNYIFSFYFLSSLYYTYVLHKLFRDQNHNTNTESAADQDKEERYDPEQICKVSYEQLGKLSYVLNQINSHMVK